MQRSEGKFEFVLIRDQKREKKTVYKKVWCQKKYGVKQLGFKSSTAFILNKLFK